MSPSILNSPDMPAPGGHYSHVCVFGQTAYISGQLPIGRDGQPLSGQPFEVQVEQVLENLEHCLRVAGTDKNQLIQVRVYVTDIGNWGMFDRLYARWIGQHRPARAVAGVKELHFGLAIEIEAIAALLG